jgi:phosphatidate cytidylyltransferase
MVCLSDKSILITNIKSLTAVKSNFLQRAITGVIFVAVLVGCILGGPISFTILFALISALTINEFGTIVNRRENTRMNKPISILAGLFLFLCFGYIGVVPGANEIFIPYLFLILYLFISELYKKQPNPLNNWAYAMMSQIYIALSFALLNVLAYHSTAVESISQYNPILPLSIFIFNWVNDTGAYCTGMLFGKHRLFERISPKKSWEGSIGGAVFSIIAAIVLAHFFTFLSTGIWIGLGLTVVVFGTWGDLTESLMKRTLGIKDSGNILPGHGGMLDRFDSTLMAVPAAVVYLYVVGLITA